MRLPAKIKGWLDKEQLLEWTQQAGDKCSYQKRLAIWLTAVGGLHAHVVAEMLGVSKQAVWKWIGQYNEYGPGGLWRQGRGGRNWAFLTEVEEANILYEVLKKADKIGLPSASQIKKAVEEKLGRVVSLAYIYRMRQRHEWSKIVSLHDQRKAHLEAQNDYARLARPWLR